MNKCGALQLAIGDANILVVFGWFGQSADYTCENCIKTRSTDNICTSASLPFQHSPSMS